MARWTDLEEIGIPGIKRSFLYSKDDRIVRHNSGAGTRR